MSMRYSSIGLQIKHASKFVCRPTSSVLLCMQKKNYAGNFVMSACVDLTQVLLSVRVSN